MKELFTLIVNRPYTISILNILLLLFGSLSYTEIPIDLLPNVDFPIVGITVPYPGASPDIIEKEVLEPLEDAVSGLRGLKSFSSSASNNVGLLILQFSLERGGKEAVQDVNEVLAANTNLLPADAQKPLVRRFDPNASPIVILNLSSKNPEEQQGESLQKMQDIIDKIIQPQLEQIDDVGQVVVVGSRSKEIQIQLNRDRLRLYGISPVLLAQQIQSFLREFPVGKIEKISDQTEIRLKVRGDFQNLDTLKNFLLETGSGARIRLDDLAQIETGLSDEKTYASYNNQPSIAILIKKRSGGNTVEAIRQIRAQIESFKKILPDSIQLNITKDNAKFIEASLDSVKVDMVLACILTILIIFLFLLNIPSTIVACLSIPTSILGTFWLIEKQGFTLNGLTALALTLSIGLVVDDAIVVIENLFRYVHQGVSRLVAAVESAREIFLPVLATTLAVVAVFVPVAMMDGILGRFFYEFGLTISLAVLVSAFVAFTLVPMLGGRYLSFEKPKGIWAHIEEFHIQTEVYYRRFLEWAMVSSKRQIGVAIGGVLIFLFSLFFLARVPKGFFPDENRGTFDISLILPPQTSLEGSKKWAYDLSAKIRENANVESVVVQIGGGENQTLSSIVASVNLISKPHITRQEKKIREEIRQNLSEFEGDGRQIIISGEQRGGGRPFQLTLKGTDPEVLRNYVVELEKYIKELPDIQDFKSSIPDQTNELDIKLNSEKLQQYGLDSQTVMGTIATLFNGRDLGKVKIASETYQARLILRAQDRLDPQEIYHLDIPNRRGQLVPLSQIAMIDTKPMDATISRQDGFKSYTISSDLKNKNVLALTNKIEQYIQKTKPDGVFYTFGGESELVKDAIKNVMKTIIIAILMVLFILWSQFESFIPPLVMILSIPLAFSGAFGALWISGKSFGIYAMIGLILLIGIATKNGIILVDFIVNRIRSGQTYKDAILEACPIRLRPILMTSLATILGMVPIVFSQGVGAEARSPMGICVMGGMITSTFLNLIFIPCIFSLIAPRIFKNHTIQEKKEA